VLLFGSLAANDYTQYSDADVLVVFERPVDWLEVYAGSDGIVQPVVKSWEVLVEDVRQAEPFYLQMLREGITLFDKGGYRNILVDMAESIF
jgi:predicted nucleotidyltransferase